MPGQQQSSAGRGIGDQDVLGNVSVHGDLTVTGTITPSALPQPIGANGTVLTANSGASGGADWEAPAGGLSAALNPPPVSAIGDQVSNTGVVTTRAALEDHQHGIQAVVDIWGGTILSPAAGQMRYVGTVQQATTAVSITAWADAACTVNVFHGTAKAGAVSVKAAAVSVSADALASGNADQNTAIAAGHGIWIDAVAVAGSPTEVGIQLNTST